MSAIERFLKSVDLDELLQAHQHVAAPSAEEISQMEGIVNAWDDPQAIANLLFYPDVLPERIRLEAIDKGLHSYDAPYLALAAVVGLQGIKPESVPEDRRTRWARTLLAMVQSSTPVLAGRASVTSFSWFREDAASLMSLYPVADETARTNILTFALARFGNLGRDKFLARVAECDVSMSAVAAFADVYDDYHQRKSRGEPGAGFMKCPLLCYIPNLSEVAVIPRESTASPVRTQRIEFFPLEFPSLSNRLKPKYKFGLAVCPVGLALLAPLAILLFWGDSHALVGGMIVSTILVSMVVGYFVGWVLNAVAVWFSLGRRRETFRRLFLYSQVPAHWRKS